MDQSDAPSQSQQNLEIARMFTSAIDTAFTSERVIERSDGSLSVGHQKQEATAQALLHYILLMSAKTRLSQMVAKPESSTWNAYGQRSATDSPHE